MSGEKVLGPTGEPYGDSNKVTQRVVEHGLVVRVSKDNGVGLPEVFWPVGMMPISGGTAFTGCFYLNDDGSFRTEGKLFFLKSHKIKLGVIREVHLLSVPHVILTIPKNLIPNWFFDAYGYIQKKGVL